MEKLNEYLLLKIYNKLPKKIIKPRVALSMVNQRFYKIFNEMVMKRMKKLENVISNNYNEKIIEMFGGIDRMKYFPIFRWKTKYLGPTQYIDQIKPEYIKYPLMLSKDHLGRPMVLVKTETYEKNENIECNSPPGAGDDFNYQFRKKIYADIIFQRYTNCNKTWTSGEYDSQGFIKESGYIMSNNFINHQYIRKNIKSLLNDKYPKITMPNFKGPVDLKLKLFQE